MPLPPRVFWSLTEAAARWGCTPADIAGWAMAGDLTIATGIPPVTCGDRIVAGLVQVDPTDAFAMFRRCGSGPRTARMRRIRPLNEAEWLFTSDPLGGIEIDAADLVIMAREMGRFEELHELIRRAPPSGGAEVKYSWNEMLAWLVVHIHENGVPESQQALIDVCRDWFEAQSPSGDAPTDRSIRRYVGGIWKELRAESDA